MKDVGSVFVCQDRGKDGDSDEGSPDQQALGPLYPCFGLKNNDLTQIRPLYDGKRLVSLVDRNVAHHFIKGAN
jgi:hypothetical protein